MPIQLKLRKFRIPLISNLFGKFFETRVGQKVKGFFSNEDILKKIIVTIFVIIIFRALASIPLPGVDMEVYNAYLGEASASEINYLMLIFTQGRLDTPSIVGLGISAYITGSIIVQLLTPVIPKLEELSKEGERGKQILNQYTRYITVVLGFFYSIAYLLILSQNDLAANDATRQGPDYLIPHTAGDWPSVQKLMFMALILTAGTILLMWLSEIITENGLGNGSSIIIAIGILSSLPALLSQDFSQLNLAEALGQVLQGNFSALGGSPTIAFFGFLIGAIITLVAIVFINEATRNIPIQYARRARSGGAQQSTLPIKLTVAGVMPVIFASSLLSLPQMIVPLIERIADAQSPFYNFIESLKGTFLFATSDNVVTQDDWLYALVYFLLIVVFGMFYSFIVMKPEETAENLKKSGAFIPGIRPGNSTASYITKILLRISFVGAIFLGVIALIPTIARNIILTQTGTNLFILSGIGGTSVLILVGVVLDTMRQYNSLKATRSYERYV